MKKITSLIAFFFLVFFGNILAQSITPPTIQWQKCLGGTDIEYRPSAEQTTDGGFIVCGYSGSNDGDVSGNNGEYDLWVVKLNKYGVIEWQKCLGGSSRETNSPTGSARVKQTLDGGYIVAGAALSWDGDLWGRPYFGSTDEDYWVVKLNSTGTIEWQKCFGGNSQDEATSIEQTSDGGYIVAGVTWSNDRDVTGYHGLGGDAWIVKLNSTGTLEWQKCLGGSRGEFAYSIHQTTDGGYIISGQSSSNDGDVSGNHSGDLDAWIVKLTSVGTIEWQKCLGGSRTDMAHSIQQTAEGGYIFSGIAGSTDGDVIGNHGGGDAWIVKLNNIGTIEWQKCLGGSNYDKGVSIQQTIDTGYVVAAYPMSNNGDVIGNHGADFWIVKLTSTGSIQWQKFLGGSADDEPNYIKQASDGGYIIAGTSASTNGDVTGNHGGYDYWVVKLTPDVLLTPDLFIKDWIDDDGTEPNPIQHPTWISQDIWLRQIPDPTHMFAHITENAEYGAGTNDTNYVYVKVRNRGKLPSTGTERLVLYWAKASSGISWTSPWLGGIYFDPGANTMLMGSPIDTVTLTTPIAPGDSTIIDFKWAPPDPALYTGALAADQNHFCLLARIVTNTGMTFPETTDLGANIQNNNNIALKNIGVYDLQQGLQKPAYATIANLSPLPITVKLKFTTTDENGKPGLLSKGVLKVTMTEELKKIIQKNKITLGEGFKDNGKGIFTLTTEGGFINNIPLEPKDFGLIKMEFLPNAKAKKLKGYTITVTQIENKGKKDHVIGGQTAVFGKVKGFGSENRIKKEGTD